MFIFQPRNVWKYWTKQKNPESLMFNVVKEQWPAQQALTILSPDLMNSKTWLYHIDVFKPLLLCAVSSSRELVEPRIHGSTISWHPLTFKIARGFLQKRRPRNKTFFHSLSFKVKGTYHDKNSTLFLNNKL